MKRGWTKKVKAVPTCAASNDALEGRHCKSQPKLKRRVRISVAMVGLVISMGAPNLLLTRQSDRAPAAEAISNEPTASSDPVTTTETAENGSVNLVEPKAVEPVSVAASSSAVEQLNQPVQPKVEVLPPVSPVIESVQKEPSLEQAQNYQVKTNSEKSTIGVNQSFGEVAGVRASKLTKPHAIALDKKAGISGYNKSQTPAIQAEKIVRIQRENRLVQKLKARQIETLSQPPSAELQRPEITKTPAIVVTPPLTESAVTVNAENPKQRALINRLKQTSNPAQDSLTELNAQAAPSPVITPLAQPNTTLTSPSRNEASVNSIVVDTVEQNVAARSPIVVKSNEEPVFGLQQSPATLAPTVESLAVPLKAPPTEASINPVVVDTVEQQNVAQPSLAPISRESPEVDLQQLPAIPEATVADSELPLETPTDSSEAAILPTPESDTEAQDLVPSDVTSNENTVLENKLEITPEIADGVPAVQDAKKELIAVVAPVQDYQVKPGDTLSAIARQHKIQVSELIETNDLSDPDLIEINQNLKIPTSQASNGIGQTITIINRPPQSKTAASASNVASVFVIPPLSSANNISSAAYTGIGGSISDAAEQVTTPAAYTGMGGSISDAAEQVTATPVDYETQVSLTNPQDLQTDIQKLRQKYYAQHRASQLMPVVNETSTVATPTQKINPQVRSLKSVNEPINPEFRVAQAVPTSQAKTKARVATAASGLDASESIQSLRGRQVSPELPPLGGVDTYFPKPNSTPLKGYIWPAKGVLTSGYGWRWGRMHKGIDIAAPIGTPILAAAPGVVVRSGWNSGGYGKLVEIKHTDGTITRYAHNNRLRVQAGQAVEQGQQISDMGSTGFSTGPHLHFEVHPGGKSAVNPIAFLPKRVTSRK